MELIQLNDLHFAYPGAAKPVLDGASLVLHPGERLALAGPTGCGKSTLLHCIVGLIRPQRGEVVVLGAPRRTEAEFQAIRGPVAMLFQESDNQLFCPMVEEDVAFGPLNQGRSMAESYALAGQTLASLGLGGYERRLNHTLSGGEKRLVALAGVLAMAPRVLLLDEPTNGLDEETESRFERILLQSGLAAIVVSHDRAFLQRIAHRQLHLVRGRVE